MFRREIVFLDFGKIYPSVYGKRRWSGVVYANFNSHDAYGEKAFFDRNANKTVSGGWGGGARQQSFRSNGRTTRNCS